MLGHILSKTWLILWWFIPFLLIGVFVWGLATMPLEGATNDPIWIYALGGGVVLTAFVFIFVMGLFVMRNQDGYTSSDVSSPVLLCRDFYSKGVSEAEVFARTFT